MFRRVYGRSLFWLTLLLSPTSFSDTLDLRRLDQQAHLVTGYAVSLTTTLLLEKRGCSRLTSVLLASVLTMSLGTLKETTDRVYDNGDQLATLLGSAASAGIVIGFEL